MSDGRGIRVLHVDDDPALADLTAEYLEREDSRLTTETASSVDRGLEHLSNADFDCIVSDYDMPARSGIDFLKTVREASPNLPFILYTGKGSEEIASEAISAGVTDYLQKGSSTGQYALLANRISNAVETYRAQTELADREKRLKERNARLRALFEQSPNMINIHDATGTITDVNPAICEQTGYDESELVGMKVWEIDRAISTDTARSMWAEMEVGERRKIEGCFERKAGSTFPVEVHLRRLRIDDEARFLVISRDISRHRKRERELKQQAAAMESSIDGMAILDGDEYVFVNEAHAEIYGYEGPDAFIGETWQMCYDDSQLERFETEIMPEIAAEGGWRGETTALRKDGSQFRQALSLTRLADDGLICVVRDITERKRQEDAMDALHQAIRAFMEAPDKGSIADIAIRTARTALNQPISCLWLHDPDSDVLRPFAVTEEAETLLGVPPTYTGGESLSWQAFESDTFKMYTEIREEPGRLNPETEIRSEMIVPLGEHGIMNLASDEPADFTPIDASLAKILGNTVEAALSRAEREEQLRTRSHELERQNERLENFTSVVSHDLRNPLNVVYGRLDLLQATTESPHLANAFDALERMEALIDDLLTLAREGERPGEPEWIALGDIAQQCWANVEAGDATLQTESTHLIRADSARLKHLLENLLGNAVEHGGDGVTITIGSHDTGFYIADDGRGLSEADADEMFERGYSTTAEGTGFGLPIVQRVAETHDWDVRVTESTEGGARFELQNVQTTPQ